MKTKQACLGLVIALLWVVKFAQPILAYRERELPPMTLLELWEIHYFFYVVLFVVIISAVLSFIPRFKNSLRGVGIGLSLVFGIFITVASLVKIPLWQGQFGICYPEHYSTCGAPGSWDYYLYTPTMLPLGIVLLTTCVALIVASMVHKKQTILIGLI